MNKWALPIVHILHTLNRIMDAPEILTALGGRLAVAQALDVPLRVVHSWAIRGFPAHAWHRIAELAVQRGVAEVTIETLRRPLWQGRRRANDAGSNGVAVEHLQSVA